MSRRNALCMHNFNGLKRVPEKCPLKTDVRNFCKCKDSMEMK